MNSRLLLNLLLLVSIVIIGLFIVNTPDKNEKNIIRLGGPDINEIRNVVIQREGLADIHVNKTDNQWQMSVPYKVAANNTAVNALLELGQAISHSRFASSDKELRDYDLKPAKASLHLNDEEYLFGNIEHINKRRYILKDNTIHLTTDLFYHRLRTNTESFISSKLIPSAANIKALKLPKLMLTRSSQGNWQVDGSEDDDTSISADAVQTLLDHWQHKQAIQVKPAQPLDNAQAVQFIFNDDSTISFQVNKPGNELILLRSDLGLQYHLPANAATDLLNLAKP